MIDKLVRVGGRKIRQRTLWHAQAHPSTKFAVWCYVEDGWDGYWCYPDMPDWLWPRYQEIEEMYMYFAGVADHEYEVEDE